jgi:hypothetical protein
MKLRLFATVINRACSLFLLASAASALAGTSTYKLDFGTPTSPVAEGFQAGEVPLLQEMIDPSFSVTDEKGAHPIEISFKGAVGAFSLVTAENPHGNPEKPLTTDYLYTFQNKPDEPTNIGFTITGLPPGSLVTLYGMCAWNGDERAGFLSLGNSDMVDLKGGAEPQAKSTSFDSFVQVASRLKAGADGKLEGVFSNSDGSKPRPEGQLAGIVLVVETP